MLNCSRQMPVEAFASITSAWIAGIGELRDAVLRTAMSGNDEWERTGKNKRKKMSEAKRRQTQ
jgi:predicted DNA-binding protein with PD1-like motif